MELKQVKVDLDTEQEGSVRAVFSTFNVIDKDGDVTLPGAFEDGQEVLISAWNHSSWGNAPAVGIGKIRQTENEAIFEGRFFLESASGRDHYVTIKGTAGQQEWSYGFDIIDSSFGEFAGQQVRFLKKVNVHEVSPVMRGAGEDTRTLDIKMALKGAIPPHETPKAPEDAPWDGPRMVAEAPNDRAVLRRMHAWVDSDGDPDLKQSYKLPHHRPDGTVVWRGVAAAMGALLGARGGPDIPDADRQGVYRHLSRHYAQFDKEPPEFRGLSIPDEYELALASLADVRGFVKRLGSLADLRVKEGRVLSAANRERLQTLTGQLREVIASIEALLTETDQEHSREELRSYLLQFERLKFMSMEVMT